MTFLRQLYQIVVGRRLLLSPSIGCGLDEIRSRRQSLLPCCCFGPGLGFGCFGPGLGFGDTLPVSLIQHRLRTQLYVDGASLGSIPTPRLDRDLGFGSTGGQEVTL